MRFTVVTPSLNQGVYLRECLESVRVAAGVFKGEAEHWVIDGGSTDNSIAILSAQNSVLWESAPDRGQSDAINKGLNRASGDILSYLCADDLLEPGALRAIGKVFAAHPGVDVVYGDGYFLEGDSGWKRKKVAGPFSMERLNRRNFLIQPAVFWRRAVWERFGGFDEELRYCMDHEYWLRLGDRVNWAYLDKPLAVSRLHPGAKTSAELTRAWWEAARMQRRYGRTFRPWCEAAMMSMGGAAWYGLKRRIFREIGRFKRQGIGKSSLP